MASEARIYGWFSSAEAPEPDYDPPHDAACPCCGAALRPDDVRTISLMWHDRRDGRAYFYRTHRTCHQALTEAEQAALDGEIFDRVAAEFPA